MSALAGIVRRDGRAASPETLSRMERSMEGREGNRRLVTRGPAALVLWEGALFLEEGGKVLAADVETQVDLGKAMESLSLGRGPDADGLAAVLWDGRRLLMSRDPLGVRPLYFAVGEEEVLFGTEAKAVLAGLGTGFRADPVRMREFRNFRFRDQEPTFFEGIRRLPAGGLFSVDAGGLQRDVSWRPDPAHRVSCPDHASYAGAFRDLFFEAVRRRLPPSGPVAFSLSGGLDSSAIVSVAARIRDEERPGLRLHAVSFLCRDFRDERDYVREVCERHKVSCTPLYFEDMDPFSGLEDALWAQESPFFDNLDAYYPYLYEAARSAGARIILGGDWGDQVLTGPGYLADLLREGSWLEFWRELGQLSRNDGGTRREIFRRVAWYLLLPHRVSGRGEWLRRLAWRVLLPGRKPAGGPVFPLASQRELYDGVFGTHNQMLLECVDRNAARRGVEMRFPFLDLRLIEFLLAVPFRERVRNGVGKQVMREALTDVMPLSVLSRLDKGDYTDPSCRRLREGGLTGQSAEELDFQWREKVLNVWEELWTREGRSGIKNPG